MIDAANKTRWGRVRLAPCPACPATARGASKRDGAISFACPACEEPPASLLARPDVLVLDGLGDESEQPVVERFCDIIKKFLQFDLDGIDSPGAKKSKTTRTAIWCGKRETLRTVLEGKEPVLILKEKEVLISNKGAL